MNTGKHSEYYWLVSADPLWSLQDAVKNYHYGFRLAIASFDSGPISPNADDLEQGWTCQNGVMLSPPLSEALKIPCDQYDEWYLAKDLSIAASDLEIFVNYGGFSLVPPVESYRDFDPTWEPGTFDFLIPIQARFWQQMLELNPETYVAMGDNDVVVSKNRDFISCVHQSQNSWPDIPQGK